ncbi:Rv2578c family radical SAM protein [Nonomuraea sp. NBC_01738]|uniref:Rv2578c family radical SAM protein n=1 Tax=Nonomuraea sp. NBC_01738 TaxID=2976003 RepID=UPI002E1678EB|nr:Rv2578c family radical SAM protein [Nonomuraea sp. NBC_01738]
MRWDNLRLTDDEPDLPLFAGGAVARTFDTPAFHGTTFYEVRARSIINRVPAGSHVPFEHTINPYRGCGHRCSYCFARSTHRYLDLDTGLDFDTKIIVKVNAPELTRKELASPRWRGHQIAMGTNVDPYQRAEGRYRLMPGIITALTRAATPFSILTKGTLILRDLDLLREAAGHAAIGVSLSIGFLDPDVWRATESGAPHPERRLETVARLNAEGIGCGVLMAPILPYLTDSPAQLARTVSRIAAAGATHVVPIVLHLRPGAREWYLAWLAREHPRLVPRYLELYGRGAYATRAYQDRMTAQVSALARSHGLARSPRFRVPQDRPRGPEQLTLL